MPYEKAINEALEEYLNSFLPLLGYEVDLKPVEADPRDFPDLYAMGFAIKDLFVILHNAPRDFPLCIVPPSLEQTIMQDTISGQYGVTSFLCRVDNRIQLFCSKEPIPTKGLFILGFDDGETGLDYGPFRFGDVKIGKVLNDKLTMYQFLKSYGIRTPITELPTCNPALLPDFLKSLKGNYVIKPRFGCRGDGVQMFSPNDTCKSIDHINELFWNQDTPLVQERIESYPIIMDGIRMDWNIRGLVASGSRDLWVGAIVRAGEYGKDPINHDKGAKCYPVGEFIEKFPRGDLEKIKRFAYGALSKVKKEFGTPNLHALVGFDIIIDDKGRPYLLEMGITAMGGLAEIADLTGWDIPGVRNLIKQFREHGKQEEESAKNGSGIWAPATISYSGLGNIRPEIMQRLVVDEYLHYIRMLRHKFPNDQKG